MDPIKEREKAKREAARNLHFLNDIARDCFDARKAELKGEGAAGRWFSPLAIHVLPKLGKMPIADINQTDIRDCLKPIWHTKASVAEKALGRLSLCLRRAAALGLTVDLQATDKARALLGKTRHKIENIPSVPWPDVPAFYNTLSDGSIAHLALRLLILTGVRSAPLRFIHEDQIEGDVWTVPAEAMKGRKDATEAFRVPLCRKAPCRVWGKDPQGNRMPMQERTGQAAVQIPRRHVYGCKDARGGWTASERPNGCDGRGGGRIETPSAFELNQVKPRVIGC